MLFDPLPCRLTQPLPASSAYKFDRARPGVTNGTCGEIPEAKARRNSVRCVMIVEFQIHNSKLFEDVMGPSC